MAPVMTSGYWPLKLGLTWYCFCEALKSVAICSSMPPSGWVRPCQNSIWTGAVCAVARLPPAIAVIAATTNIRAIRIRVLPR